MYCHPPLMQPRMSYMFLLQLFISTQTRRRHKIWYRFRYLRDGTQVPRARVDSLRSYWEPTGCTEFKAFGCT